MVATAAAGSFAVDNSRLQFVSTIYSFIRTVVFLGLILIRSISAFFSDENIKGNFIDSVHCVIYSK